jgi:hypothetical protein
MPTMTTERVWEEFHAPLQQFILHAPVSESAGVLPRVQRLMTRGVPRFLSRETAAPSLFLLITPRLFSPLLTASS